MTSSHCAPFPGTVLHTVGLQSSLTPSTGDRVWGPGSASDPPRDLGGHSSAPAPTCERGNWARWCQVPFSPNIFTVVLENQENPTSTKEWFGNYCVRQAARNSFCFVGCSLQNAWCQWCRDEDKKQRRKHFRGHRDFQRKALAAGRKRVGYTSLKGRRLCRVTRALRSRSEKEDKGSYIKHKALHGLREQEQLSIHFGSCCSKISKLKLMAT